MLVAVIMFFLVFSYTGVAILNTAYISTSTSQQTVQNIKLQYATETIINEALWGINVGADSAANYSSDGVSCLWDSTSQCLSVNIQNFNSEAEMTLDLSSDTHFNRSLSSNLPIETYGYVAQAEEQHSSRIFQFLPLVDLDYFMDHAVAIHRANDASWKPGSFSAEGIHIFTGNNLDISGISLSNSTFIFTGKYITFSGINSISAPLPADSADALPALVFIDPEVNVLLGPDNQINGAVYCAGRLVLLGPDLSGPVMGNLIVLNDDIVFTDAQHAGYYRWTTGFFNRFLYDWPKQIGRWHKTKWNTRV